MTKEEFFAHCSPEPNTGCWLWTRMWDKDGYGRVRHNGKQRGAHRVAFELFRGAIPEGMCVCHRCDTPACCNPDHLFLGTSVDNVVDRVAKGRTRVASGDRHGSRTHPERMARGDRHPARLRPEYLARGENHRNAKLTWAQVDAIRRRLLSGATRTAIARSFLVSRSTIDNIANGKIWRTLSPDRQSAARTPDSAPSADR